MNPMMHKAARFELKAADDKGEFSGYASVFDIEDADGEAIAAGAFDASLEAHQANGTDPALLWQHQVAEPIGKWVELEEDAKGLRAKGKIFIDGIQRAREAFILLKEKAVTGLSIGFIPKKWEFDVDNFMVTFTEVDLLEVSIVTLPANPQARIGEVKRRAKRAHLVFSGTREEIDNPRAFERFLRDAGFSRSEAVAITGRGFIRSSQGEPDQGEQQQREAVAEQVKTFTRYIHECRDTLRSKTAR